MSNKNTAWIECKAIDDRMDATLYLTQINMGIFQLIENQNYNFNMKSLNDICEKIVDGPFGSAILESDYVASGIPFIRVQNVTEYGFNDENLSYISEKANDKINRSECKPGDLVITKTGRLGTACVLNRQYNIYNIRGDLAKLEIKQNVDQYFVMAYLNSDFGTKITNSFSSGSTRGRVLLSNIKKILIPIPSSEIQKYIGDKVRKAEELREEAKMFKKEAEELLLNWIGLDKENIDKEPDSKYVWVGSKHIYDRLDCQYYNTLYEEIEAKLMKNRCENLIDLCEDYSITVPYSTDFGVKSGENIYPMYRVKNVEEYFTNNEDLLYMNSSFYDNNEKCRVSTEDILLSRVGSIGRASIYLNSQNATMGQNVTRIRLKDNINKYYFLCYINSDISQLLMKRETNAGLQPNLTNENIKSLKVPILNKNIQDEIGNKILKYINMTINSKQLIEEAKQDVENLIEGNFNI